MVLTHTGSTLEEVYASGIECQNLPNSGAGTPPLVVISASKTKEAAC